MSIYNKHTTNDKNGNKIRFEIFYDNKVAFRSDNFVEAIDKALPLVWLELKQVKIVDTTDQLNTWYAGAR